MPYDGDFWWRVPPPLPGQAKGPAGAAYPDAGGGVGLIPAASTGPPAPATSAAGEGSGSLGALAGYGHFLRDAVRSALSGRYLDPHGYASSYLRMMGRRAGEQIADIAMHPEDIIGPGNLTGTVIGRIGAGNLARAGYPMALNALRSAQLLWESGIHPDDVVHLVNRTIAENDPALGGLVQLPDKQWGVEISNHGAQFVPPPPALPGARYGAPSTARAVLRSPDLDAAYPGLRTVLTHSIPENRSTYMPPDVGGWWADRIALGELRPDRPRSMAHEIEHYVQTVEGFPSGSSARMFMEPDGSLRHLLAQGETPQEAYARTAGEWFARQAANRMDMTGPELRANPLEPPQGLLVTHRPRPPGVDIPPF